MLASGDAPQFIGGGACQDTRLGRRQPPPEVENHTPSLCKLPEKIPAPVAFGEPNRIPMVVWRGIGKLCTGCDVIAGDLT
jgi:hypothetical protein